MATPPVSGQRAPQKGGFCSSTNGSRSEKSRDSPARRKLTFGKLPYQDEKIFLDVAGFKDVQQVEQDLQQLGASIEKFLTADTTCVVSNRSAKQRSSVSGKLFSSGPVSSPCVAISRGRALLQKSTSNSSAQSSDVLNTAKKRGLRIVSLNEVLKVIRKESRRDGFATPLRHGVKPHVGVKALNGIFIKVEDSSSMFKPYVGRFEEFPRAYSLQDVNHSFEAAKILLKSSPAKLGSKSSMQKSSSHRKKDRSKSGKDVSKSCAKKLKEAQKNRGYCELCDVWYENVKQHTNSLVHKEYAENDQNFNILVETMNKLPELDALIGSLSSFTTSNEECDTSAVSDDFASTPAPSKVNPLEVSCIQTGPANKMFPPAIDLVDVHSKTLTCHVSNQDITKSNQRFSRGSLGDITNQMKESVWSEDNKVDIHCVKSDPVQCKRRAGQMGKTYFRTCSRNGNTHVSVRSSPAISPLSSCPRASSMLSYNSLEKLTTLSVSKDITLSDMDVNDMPSAAKVKVSGDSTKDIGSNLGISSKDLPVRIEEIPSSVKSLPPDKDNHSDKVLTISESAVCDKRTCVASGDQHVAPSNVDDLVLPCGDQCDLSRENKFFRSERNQTLPVETVKQLSNTSNYFSRTESNASKASGCGISNQDRVLHTHSCSIDEGICDKTDGSKQSMKENLCSGSQSSELNFGNVFKQLSCGESLELNQPINMYSSASCTSQPSFADKLDQIIQNIVVNNDPPDDVKDRKVDGVSDIRKVQSSPLHASSKQHGDAEEDITSDAEIPSLHSSVQCQQENKEDDKEDTDVDVKSSALHSFTAQRRQINEEEEKESTDMCVDSSSLQFSIAQYRRAYMTLDDEYSRDSLDDNSVDSFAEPATDSEVSMSSNTFLTGISKLYEQSRSVEETKKAICDISDLVELQNISKPFATSFAEARELYGLDQNFNQIDTKEQKPKQNECLDLDSTGASEGYAYSQSFNKLDKSTSSGATLSSDSTIAADDSEMDESFLRTNTEFLDPSFELTQDTTSTCDSDTTVAASDDDESFVPSTSTSPRSSCQRNATLASLQSTGDPTPDRLSQHEYLPFIPKSENSLPPTSEVDVVTRDMIDPSQRSSWRVINDQCTNLKVKFKTTKAAADWESEESVDSSNSQWIASPHRQSKIAKLKFLRKAPVTPLTDFARRSKVKWSVRRSGDCKLVFCSTGKARLVRKRQNEAPGPPRSSKRRRLSFEGMYTETLLGF